SGDLPAEVRLPLCTAGSRISLVVADRVGPPIERFGRSGRDGFVAGNAVQPGPVAGGADGAFDRIGRAVRRFGTKSSRRRPTRPRQSKSRSVSPLELVPNMPPAGSLRTRRLHYPDVGGRTVSAYQPGECVVVESAESCRLLSTVPTDIREMAAGESD